MMKEINVVSVGSSFDLNNLKNLKGPIFFSPAWSPLRIDNDGKVLRVIVGENIRVQIDYLLH